WMSNWLYANEVPTTTWRNAMTIPRELKIKHVGKDIFVVSQPVMELSKIESKPVIAENIKISKSADIAGITGKIGFPSRLDLNFSEKEDFSLVISNDSNEELIIGYDKRQNEFFIDRTKSGKTDFQKDFAAKVAAPRFTDKKDMSVSLIIDVSSIELFADDGLTVMTAVFFPNSPFHEMQLQTPGSMVVKKLVYRNLTSTREK
ncbi:MAG: GH32 C-terminal domain-containing protein, partial [Ferruginibacter sp.]